MLIYQTGDLLDSPAQALVNTVNCEGVMGKGIAYQFKQRYPENFKDYQRACQSGELRPGKLHHFFEGGKQIINFPTKDKWRNPSKMEYIESGLDELAPLIQALAIKSIAIPPLGSGNGGLAWAQVRELIEAKLAETAKTTDIFVYGPAYTPAAQPIQEPRLGMPALVLMEIKANLHEFSALRLQVTAYFMDVFSHSQYFKFGKNSSGPYSRSIDAVAHHIKAYQEFYGKSTEEAKEILYRKLVSKTVEAKLKKLFPAIKQACALANAFPSNHDLECLGTVCYLVEKGGAVTEKAVIEAFSDWSEDKAARFSKDEISRALQILCEWEILDRNLEGYYLV